MNRIKFFITILLLSLPLLTFAQKRDITVKGKVVDAAEKYPMVGAAVQIKGSPTDGVAVDIDGFYTIKAAANDVLVFSYINFKTEEIPVNGRSEINVEMIEDAIMLEQTIVIGYGTAKKISSVVGSASTVKAAAIANRPSANVGDALQGQVSGLQVFSSTGEPMSNVNMRIRGVNSISASNSPLFILDGSPVSASVFTSLTPSDIENISVLKDASSTAIYGSRAANGVIFVTTKKGKQGEKPVIQVRGQYGVSNMVSRNVKLMDTEQWFTFNKIVDPNFLSDAPGNDMPERYAFAKQYNINTDWRDVFFEKNAPVWSSDISISGATEKTDYFISGSCHGYRHTSIIKMIMVIQFLLKTKEITIQR